MSGSIRINANETEPCVFRIKTFDYNSYRIDHPQIQGVLRLASIPTDIMKVPDEKFPPDADVPDEAKYVLGYQTIVGFTNTGEKKTPTVGNMPQRKELKKAKKMELTSYITQSSVSEPWNEYVISGADPKLLKTKTILSKLEWYIGITNRLGDPYLWANSNTTINVSDNPIPEVGNI